MIGLEELDNLVDLDLTDNLLGQHSSLKPFQYLHHLSVVSLLSVLKSVHCPGVSHKSCYESQVML